MHQSHQAKFSLNLTSMDCESDITAGLKWKPPHNASSNLTEAVTDCQQTCFANTLQMIKMSLTVLSGGVANSPSSISINLTGMAGTFLLHAFFNKHVLSSNTNPHRVDQKKYIYINKIRQLVRKRVLGKCTFLPSAEKNIYSGSEDALENV